jgi:hypothetical protein
MENHAGIGDSGYSYDYQSSTTVQYSERIAFVDLHRSPHRRTRTGAKEEQICV